MLPGMNGLEAAARIRAREETRTLPIVLISAYAGKEEEARCAELGVNVFLPKPITASSLFDAVVEAQGARVHAARRALDVPLEREFDARVLLAEDNEANQMVASEILGRLGIELDIANNGREALEMVRAARGKYAAVLMDMQMPEMDGLAATRAMREDPALHDLPIIAMTANAMKADLDACLAAGMNDHITKPIERKALLQTLRRWLPARQNIGRHDPGASRTQRLFPDRQRYWTTVRGSRASTWQGRWRGSASSSRPSGGCSSGSRTARVRRSTRCGRPSPQATAPRLHDTRTPSRERPAILAPTVFMLQPRRSSARAARARGISPICSPIWKPGPPWCSAPSTPCAELARPSPPSAGRCRFQRRRAPPWSGCRRRSAISTCRRRASALADLDRAAMPGVASDLARLRNHVDSYEYEEARVLATRLLEQIGSEVS